MEEGEKKGRKRKLRGESQMGEKGGNVGAFKGKFWSQCTGTSADPLRCTLPNRTMAYRRVKHMGQRWTELNHTQIGSRDWAQGRWPNAFVSKEKTGESPKSRRKGTNRPSA